MAKHKWLHRRQNRKLLLFCNGWGMDEYPLTLLKSHEWNVLMFYDYVDLKSVHSPTIKALFINYEEIILVAWSMGVWAGQQLFFHHRECLKAALALNGTLCPIDDRFGIPVKVVQATLESFGGNQRKKFYHRMCRKNAIYSTFLKYQPLRSVDNQKKELAYLLATVNRTEKMESIYSCAHVADQDYIIPTAHQLDCWPERLVRRVKGYHFPFFSYQSWDELVMEILKDGE